MVRIGGGDASTGSVVAMRPPGSRTAAMCLMLSVPFEYRIEGMSNGAGTSSGGGSGSTHALQHGVPAAPVVDDHIVAVPVQERCDPRGAAAGHRDRVVDVGQASELDGEGTHGRGQGQTSWRPAQRRQHLRKALVSESGGDEGRSYLQRIVRTLERDACREMGAQGGPTRRVNSRRGTRRQWGRERCAERPPNRPFTDCPPIHPSPAAMSSVPTSTSGTKAAVNYLGAFPFTNLLVPRLAQGAHVVMVVGNGYALAYMRFSDYNFNGRDTLRYFHLGILRFSHPLVWRSQ